MDELVQELRRASELFSDDGWWKPEVLSKAADELEQLRHLISIVDGMLFDISETSPRVRRVRAYIQHTVSAPAVQTCKHGTLPADHRPCPECFPATVDDGK